MPPEKYEALKRLNQGGGTDTVFQMDGYGDVETLPWGGDNDVMREATAASPLQPMPLAVLAHGKPFPQSAEAPGFASGELEGFCRRGTRTWPHWSRMRVSWWPPRAGMTFTRINPSW